MRYWVYFLGGLFLYATISQINNGNLIPAERVVVYVVTGISLIFCGLYISNLEKTNKGFLELNKELLKNNQKLLNYLNRQDDDPDPDDGERISLVQDKKPKTNVVSFPTRNQAS